MDDHADRVGVAPLGTPTAAAVADSYTELDELEHATGLRWQQRPTGPHKPPLPRKDDLDVLAALHELRFLTPSQIRRRFMAGRALRSVQHRLGQMFRVGWVRRCELATRRRGHTQRVYALDEAGFELLQANSASAPLGHELDSNTKWHTADVEDARLVLHDLHANAWLFALEDLLAPGVLRGWRGPLAARLDVPGERVRGQWIALTPDTVPLGTGQHLANLQLDEFRPVRPDLAVELDLSLGNTRRRVELLIELDRSGRASSNYAKFRRYDAFLNAWGMALPRYTARTSTRPEEGAERKPADESSSRAGPHPSTPAVLVPSACDMNCHAEAEGTCRPSHFLALLLLPRESASDDRREYKYEGGATRGARPRVLQRLRGGALQARSRRRSRR
jgi:hypothetical protein